MNHRGAEAAANRRRGREAHRRIEIEWLIREARLRGSGMPGSMHTRSPG